MTSPGDLDVTPWNAVRRTLLRRSLGAAAGGLAWSGAPAATPTATLNWLDWNANMRPACLAPFTAATGIELRRQPMGSLDELFQTLKTGGGRDLDAISPQLEVVDQLIAAGLLQKFDLSKLPNFAAMYPVLRDSPHIRDGRDVYALPYMWGLNPLVYRADRVRGLVDYDTLFDPRYKGRIALWDVALSGIGIAAMHLGIPPDQAFELDARALVEVRKLLLAQKPLVRSYWKNLDELVQLFDSGEVVVAHSWRAPYDQLKDRWPMRIGTPAQGALAWGACIALPAHMAPAQAAQAHRLANYLLGEAFGHCMGINGPYAGAHTAARAGFTPAQQREIFIDDLAAIPNFLWPKAPQNYAAWQRLWEEVKAS